MVFWYQVEPHSLFRKLPSKGRGLAISFGYWTTDFLVVQRVMAAKDLPMFGTVILGMLWKRTTPAAGFWGLVAGIMTSLLLWLWVKLDPSALKYVAFSEHAKDMAENIYRAMWTLAVNVVVTVAVSLVTKPKPEHELRGLVYGMTELPAEGQFPVFKRPAVWAAAVGVGFIALNILFW